MSLVGIVRHPAKTEPATLRNLVAPKGAPRIDRSPGDGDVDGVIADPAVASEAWQTCDADADADAEVPRASEIVDDSPDPGATADDPLNQHGSGGGTMSLRKVLVRMIEEYSRHQDHVDLLRVQIDQRVGQ